MPKVTSLPDSAARRLLDRRVEGRFVADHVVGRQHQQQRVIAICQGLQRGDRDGRSGIAAYRLEDQCLRQHLALAQLLGSHEAVLLVGDHDRCRAGDGSNPLPGGLQHGVIADQRQELLRIGLARQRPQPRARAAGQNDGDNWGHAKYVLLSDWLACRQSGRSARGFGPAAMLHRHGSRCSAAAAVRYWSCAG